MYVLRIFRSSIDRTDHPKFASTESTTNYNIPPSLHSFLRQSLKRRVKTEGEPKIASVKDAFVRTKKSTSASGSKRLEKDVSAITKSVEDLYSRVDGSLKTTANASVRWEAYDNAYLK